MKKLFFIILCECGFYGLMICGYLIWTSNFLSLKNEGASAIGPFLIMTVFWVFYIVLMIKTESKSLNLVEITSIKKSKALINFMVMIFTQLLYLILSISLSNSDNYTPFVWDQLTVTVIPISVLSLLTLSLLVNMFLWIWEIKQS
jgi:hypothetical protein